MFTVIVENYHNDGVAITRVDFDFDRVRFDAIDGRRTYLGQHALGVMRERAAKFNPVFAAGDPQDLTHRLGETGRRKQTGE